MIRTIFCEMCACTIDEKSLTVKYTIIAPLIVYGLLGKVIPSDFYHCGDSLFNVQSVIQKIAFWTNFQTYELVKGICQS